MPVPAKRYQPPIVCAAKPAPLATPNRRYAALKSLCAAQRSGCAHAQRLALPDASNWLTVALHRQRRFQTRTRQHADHAMLHGSSGARDRFSSFHPAIGGRNFSRHSRLFGGAHRIAAHQMRVRGDDVDVAHQHVIHVRKGGIQFNSSPYSCLSRSFPYCDRTKRCAARHING